MNSPGLGDIDDDGAIDIVVGTNECYDEPINASLSSGTAAALAQLLAAAGQSSCNSRVYAIHKDGTNHAGGPFHAGWPVHDRVLHRRDPSRTSARASTRRRRSPTSTATGRSRSASSRPPVRRIC